MTRRKILHRDGVTVLFDCAAPTVLRALEAAVAARADLAGADLTRADLTRANLAGAYLAGADLTGADLAGAYLAGANLAGANLAGADLTGADLTRAYLAGAYLAGANLAGANLAGADLTGADLTRAYLTRAYLVDGGQDRRGYRFWLWRNADGVTVYRAGCREWTSIEAALAHFGGGYSSNGDVAECLARLRFMADEAARRWPEVSGEANLEASDG